MPIIELAGGKAPENWDGVSFTNAFKKGGQSGREHLIVSQCAWSCQRSVRFEDYICIRSYHDGYHGFPDVMLFSVKGDLCTLVVICRNTWNGCDRPVVEIMQIVLRQHMPKM